MAAVQFKLDAFEGPLDLLLHLIDDAKVDIFDIPIQEITRQYLVFLENAQELELEVASEFLVMAATLLFIKSQMILPKPPVLETDDEFGFDYEDPRAKLVQKLIEYRQFRAIADYLRARESFWQFHLTKEPEDLSPYRMITELPLEIPRMHAGELQRAYIRLTRKTKVRQVVHTIQRDEVTVRDRMDDIERELGHFEGKILLSQLLTVWRDRIYVITTFLAILELMKMRKVKVHQHTPYGDLIVTKREEAEQSNA